MTLPCVLAWALVLACMPLLLLAWAVETPETRIRRWRRQGMTQQAIADRLNISRWQVRKALQVA